LSLFFARSQSLATVAEAQIGELKAAMREEASRRAEAERRVNQMAEELEKLKGRVPQGHRTRVKKLGGSEGAAR
jgi:hypothetical protein